MMNGTGELRWNSEGRKYFGYFLNDKRNEFGIFIWKKPFKIFIGFWVNGKQNGVGKYMDSKKEKYGIWISGKLVRWFKNKQEINQYIEPQYRKYMIYFKASIQEIKNIFLKNENW
jgi:hypothetical protein